MKNTSLKTTKLGKKIKYLGVFLTFINKDKIPNNADKKMFVIL